MYAPSRRSVLSNNASVATNHPIATHVGIQTLKAGGNAADAAVAIAATLNVVDPGNTGLGGDCFVLYYDSKTKTVKGINGSGRSPSKLTLGLLEQNGISIRKGCKEIPDGSAFSVTVPGAAAGWVDTIKTFGSGKLSMLELLNPAIGIAENGFPVTEVTSNLQRENSYRLKRTAYSHGDDLMINGKTPGHGQIMTNPKLANVFKTLATGGKEEFYTGEIAQSIVSTVVAAGGCLDLDDMKNHSSTFDDPISTTYNGIKVWEMPPNGQGLIALMALNIIEGFDITNDQRISASCLHKMIEATQIAFADGTKFIGDPSKNSIPLEILLSKEYAGVRKNLIDLTKANPSNYKASELETGNDTVYFSVVDSDGNACSFINSIYKHFGSGLVPKNCGFILHCRGNMFSLDENHINCVEPLKRPYHSIIPGMATHASNDELYSCFGVMGGYMQPQGHLQVLSNLIDFKMDPQSAICLPRFCIDHSSGSHVVYIENTIPECIVEELRQLGHNIVVLDGALGFMFGGAQVIQVRTDCAGNKVLWAGSESRQDGCAMGY